MFCPNQTVVVIVKETAHHKQQPSTISVTVAFTVSNIAKKKKMQVSCVKQFQECEEFNVNILLSWIIVDVPWDELQCSLQGY